MIRFDCSGCGATLRVPDDKAGKRGKCPKCGSVISVPMATATAGQPARTAARRQASSPAPKIGAALDGSRLVDAMEREQAATDASVATCRLCGKPLRLDGVNCPHCGSLQRDVTVPGPGRAAPARVGLAVACPSCRTKHMAGSKICPPCGVRIPSGRPVLTARAPDEDKIEETCENILRPLSWLIPFGLYPFYSEAGGHSKPYVTWAIAALTVLVSMAALFCYWTDTGTGWVVNGMLWPRASKMAEAADLKPADELTEQEWTDLVREVEQETGEKVDEEAAWAEYIRAVEEYRPPDLHRTSQLLTHTLLHADLMHLAGNLIFLLVFATRVNSAIGNVATLLVYMLLAVVAAEAHMAMTPADQLGPMLGASGAIMGMAGLYFVLFPLHKVHMVIWMRWGLLAGFKLSRATFALWGFLVVGFYIAFDVLYTVFGLESTTAHWAHLGGFIGGAALGLILLSCRMVHSGGDLLSLILGRFAWPMIGTPASHVSRKPMFGLW